MKFSFLQLIGRFISAAFASVAIASFISALIWSPVAEDFFHHRWFATVAGIWAMICAVLVFWHASPEFRSAIRQFREGTKSNDEFDGFWW